MPKPFLGLFRPFLRLFGPFLGLFRPFLGLLGHFWGFLGHFWRLNCTKNVPLCFILLVRLFLKSINHKSTKNKN